MKNLFRRNRASNSPRRLTHGPWGEVATAMLAPMAITFSFAMAVIDADQRPIFASLAAAVLGSSGLVSAYSKKQSSQDDEE